MNFKSTFKRYPVTIFLILVLSLSFAAFLTPVPPTGAFATLAFLLLPIPTMTAFALASVIEGHQGATHLLPRSFRWRASWKWYLIAMTIGFVIHLDSSILALVTGHIPVIEFSSPTAFFITYFPLTILEEIGWRGFALHRLLDKQPLLSATLIIGIPWALLHFALFLFFVPDVSPVADGLVVFSFAFPLTWTYVRSGRNVVVATVLHGALNAFAILGEAINPAEVLWFVAASGGIVTAFLVLLDWKKWFTTSTRTLPGDVMPARFPVPQDTL